MNNFHIFLRKSCWTSAEDWSVSFYFSLWIGHLCVVLLFLFFLFSSSLSLSRFQGAIERILTSVPPSCLCFSDFTNQILVSFDENKFTLWLCSYQKVCSLPKHKGNELNFLFVISRCSRVHNELWIYGVALFLFSAYLKCSSFLGSHFFVFWSHYQLPRQKCW